MRRMYDYTRDLVGKRSSNTALAQTLLVELQGST